jgi:hypothetical protein
MAEIKKKLPQSEWNFSKIKPDQISYAFFYEYARQVDRVKKLVAEYRKLHPYIVHVPGVAWSFPEEKVENLSRDELESIRKRVGQFKKNDYLSMIRWLSYCDKFPDTPFLKLDTADYQITKEVPLYSRHFPVNHRGFCDVESCWARDYKGKSRSVEDGSEIFQYMAETGPDEDHVTTHLIFVDWWKSDSELKEDFYKWIKFHRKNYQVKPVKTLSRGLLNRPLDLPKECRKMGTALSHLGKLRCLEAAGSWEKYLAAYHTEKSDRRYLEKDVSAARKVISWLEDKV